MLDANKTAHVLFCGLTTQRTFLGFCAISHIHQLGQTLNRHSQPDNTAHFSHIVNLIMMHFSLRFTLFLQVPIILAANPQQIWIPNRLISHIVHPTTSYIFCTSQIVISTTSHTFLHYCVFWMCESYDLVHLPHLRVFCCNIMWHQSWSTLNRFLDAKTSRIFLTSCVNSTD